MFKFLFILLAIFLFFFFSLITILRRIRGFFNSVVGKQYDPTTFDKGTVKKTEKKEEILYQNGEIKILKGEAKK